ncbi:MAG: tRNA (guanine-N(1)-)-methyltransferase [Bacteroidetes bacterium ADurb.Bin408]|nr:MAG: tRNA (guanine-N(1)-)-methyltransferase [Bacteroidetes bacterium ADurb.Bin408]
MRIDILTLFPAMFSGVFGESIIKRALAKKHVEIYIHNIRDYALNKHKQVDDYAFGGGAGMVMMIEPVANCIRKLKGERKYDEVIFMTPDGEVFDQMKANYFSTLSNLIVLCGHYKGIDERIRSLFITREISIGDYVLSGGEIPAMAFCDAVIRLIPGVLNDETSALSDSFQNGLLSAPVYTRPSDFEGHKVPAVLLSGHDKEIEKWRSEQSLLRTEQRRPDLLK